MEKVIIIGGGCAGLTASIYCARAELNPLVFVGDINDGGLLTKTSIVENYPGFPEGIGGNDLMDNLEKQAKIFGSRLINKKIASIDIDKEEKKFIVVDSENIKHTTESIIISTGSKPRKLELDDEEKFWTKGISSCAVCDGFRYRKKKIIVVGGGDSAFEEALFLTKYSDVTLIHRRDNFRGSNIMQKRVLDNKKITILYDTIITKLYGNEELEAIGIKNIKTNEEKKMDVDGLFYGLGLIPNSKIFLNKMQIDNDGYILRQKITSDDYESQTSVEGIFVAGDVCDKIYKQAIVACGDGCKSAMDVIKYLSNKKE